MSPARAEDRPPTVLDTGQGAHSGSSGVVWETAPFNAAQPAAPATNGTTPRANRRSPAAARPRRPATSPAYSTYRPPQATQARQPPQPMQPAQPARPAQPAGTGNADTVPIQVIVVPRGRRSNSSHPSTGASVGAGGHSASGHIMGAPGSN